MEQNNMKKTALTVVAVIAAGGIVFYGGMTYGQSKTPNFQNLTPDQRQQMFQQGGTGANGARGARTGTGANFARNGAGANPVSGEIISKDDKSITIKLRDGGSQIVFFSGSTEISKFISGTSNDLAIGENIFIGGSKNPDGSVTATTIQLRPVLPSPLGSPAPSSN